MVAPPPVCFVQLLNDVYTRGFVVKLNIFYSGRYYRFTSSFLQTLTSLFNLQTQ